MAKRNSSALLDGMLKGMEMGARIKAAGEAQAMKDEFKKLDEPVKPSKGFVVTGPDGASSIYADEKMAREAADSLAGSQLDSKYLVAGKQFDTEEDAATGAAAMNSPAAKLRQRSEIALKYNRPDLAEAYQRNYKQQMDANRAEMQQAFNQAAMTGDVNAVVDQYNKRLPNGVNTELVPNEDGSLTLNIKKGNTVYQQRPFASTNDFFEKMTPLMAATPDNMVELWSKQEGLKQQAKENARADRKLDHDITSDNRRLAQGDTGLGLQAQQVGAAVRKTNAEVAQMPAEMRLKERQVGATELGAQATAANAQTQRLGLTVPKIHSGVDASGDVSFGATQPVLDPKTGQWGLNVIGPQVAPGMRPTPRQSGSGLDALLMGGAGAHPAPLVIDWSKVPAKEGHVPATLTPDPRINIKPR